MGYQFLSVLVKQHVLIVTAPSLTKLLKNGRFQRSVSQDVGVQEDAQGVSLCVSQDADVQEDAQGVEGLCEHILMTQCIKILFHISRI